MWQPGSGNRTCWRLRRRSAGRRILDRAGRGRRCLVERGDRDPQDRPRHRDHAGEPLLRHLLRDLSGRRRHPDVERVAHGLRVRSRHRRVRCAVPRHARPYGRRPAWAGQRDGRHRGRRDERLRRPGRAGEERVPERLQPRLRGHGHAGRDGLRHRRRDPQLLELRAQLRAPGPHVRAERVVEPARPPVHRVGLVSEMQRPGQPDELPERHQSARPADRGEPHPVCLD